MRRLLVAGTLALAPMSAAQAAYFSFTSTSRPAGEVTTHLSLGGGRERLLATPQRFGAYNTQGETTSRSAGGAIVHGQMRCTYWNTQGEDTNVQGVCEVSEGPQDRWAFTYLCNFKGGLQDGGWCWGAVSGQGGRYAGKRGSLTWRDTAGQTVGQGAWRD